MEKSRFSVFKIFDIYPYVSHHVRRSFVYLYLLIAVPARAAYWWLRLLFIKEAPPSGDPHEFDVICFSHVPWSHIWQRNHHTMTRLAKARQVVYFQTTSISYIHWFMRNWPHARWEFANTFPGLTLVYPLLYPGQSRVRVLSLINRWLISTHVRWVQHTMGLRNTVFWFYYPAAAHVLESVKPAAVVYDIQDEYSAFEWSPRDITAREQYLLRRADIIFAGTHALYETKRSGFAGKAFFYPCAVEFSHFFSAAPIFNDTFFESNPHITDAARGTILRIANAFAASGQAFGTVSVPEAKEVPVTSSKGAVQRATVSAKYKEKASHARHLNEPVEIARLGHPRLLYVGLIDNRIDPDLLAHMGQAHPEWEILMLGPVDHRVFDQQSVEMAAPNVRFLGPALYRWLPNFMAHSDVYLMPWKVNKLTLHINPTKTLEYMAAARPVVSISLPDLQNLFADSVNLATTYEGFVAECEAALDGKRWDKVAAGLQRAWSFAWETVVQEMEQHVTDTLREKTGLRS